MPEGSQAHTVTRTPSCTRVSAYEVDGNRLYRTYYLSMFSYKTYVHLDRSRLLYPVYIGPVIAALYLKRSSRVLCYISSPSV